MPDHITLNGSTRPLTPGETLTDLVSGRTGHPLSPTGEATDGQRLGIAVAVNSRVVARSLWATTPLAPGDAVELVSAVQGG